MNDGAAIAIAAHELDAEPDHPRATADGANAFLLAALFLLVGLLTYGAHTVDGFTAIPGDLGDARFNSVILEHAYRWARGLDASFWSPGFFFPFERVLAFSDNLIGSAPFYAALRSVGLGREMAFDAWYLVGVILNFSAAWVCLRRLGIARVGAAAGAFVYAFALPVLAQENHAQLDFRFAIPLAYAAGWDLLTTGNLRAVGRLAIWCTVQFFCSIYLGVFLVYLALATWCATIMMGKTPSLIAGLRISWRQTAGRLQLTTVAVVCVAIGAVLSLLRQYHVVGADYHLSAGAEVVDMLPRYSSYFLADRSALSSWVGAWAAQTPRRHEHQLFFGVGVWLLGTIGAIGAWRRPRRFRVGKVATVTLTLIGVATFSVGPYSLYLLLTWIPGVGALRAVARIVLVMLLPIGILVAYGTDWIMAQVQRRSWPIRAAAVLVLLAVVSLETVYYHPYNTPSRVWSDRQATLRTQLPPVLNPDAIIAVRRQRSEPDAFTELDGMVLAQDLGVATLNGYSGNRPPGYVPPTGCDAPEARIAAYVQYRSATAELEEALRRRVVRVGFGGCN